MLLSELFKGCMKCFFPGASRGRSGGVRVRAVRVLAGLAPAQDLPRALGMHGGLRGARSSESWRGGGRGSGCVSPRVLVLAAASACAPGRGAPFRAERGGWGLLGRFHCSRIASCVPRAAPGASATLRWLRVQISLRVLPRRRAPARVPRG